ncbi:NADPH-dependent FMN reductase [Sediminivirga luteola]|uniref:FMN reductase n=1 Tax=Sediminivirga luteola TaxID=1774748 RepID=A0A8J2TZ33_9MICO|nr:NAD(P)H-dependent oxidoreductase [Sediminivirga luteola]GGA19346.1 FMN reductase [Sediminivirga luteola]
MTPSETTPATVTAPAGLTAVTVVGNPKKDSRTRAAAERVAAQLGAQNHTIELSELGPGLLGWGDPAIAQAVSAVQGADLAIFASPTFKAAYTGLLKLFLDQFPGGTGLQDVVAVPLMLGGSQAHSLAPELTLRPVLSELGATCPAAALYLIDSQYETDGALEAWVERWGGTVAAACRAAGSVREGEGSDDGR